MTVFVLFALSLQCAAGMHARTMLAPRSRVAVRSTSAPLMGLLGRLRSKREVEAPPQITEGAPLPEIEIEAILFNVDEDESEVEESASQSDVKAAVLPLPTALGNGTTVLVGMPGAFTPTCTDKHLPGFVKQSETLKGLGVERIAVVTTNDRYVNSAWNKAIEECMTTKSPLLMLSDADGDLVKAMGLVDDMGFGLGLRSKRFVVVAESGMVRHVLVDEGSDALEATSAEAVVRLLTPPPPAAVDEEAAVGPAAAAAAIAALFVALYVFSAQDAPPSF